MENLFTLLPTKMISKTDINGVKIDYEEYLTDLLNVSMYFSKLTQGCKFRRILNQSHGEADVVANNYELDFKLLVNQEFVNTKLKSLPDVDYSNIKNRLILVTDKPISENNVTQAQANSLFINFLYRLVSTKEEQIRSHENDKDYFMYSTIKMMKKEKNLFIFLPCVINITGKERITNILKIFLLNPFSLRDNIEKDTYVTILSSDNYFYILKYENGSFICVDNIHKALVFSFNNIYKYTYFLERN